MLGSYYVLLQLEHISRVLEKAVLHMGIVWQTRPFIGNIKAGR